MMLTLWLVLLIGVWIGVLCGEHADETFDLWLFASTVLTLLLLALKGAAVLGVFG